MTAEGYVWKKLINPNNYSYIDLLNFWYREPARFDPRENIGVINNFGHDIYFSDERLIRRLRADSPIDIFEMERGYANFMDSTLDRYDWKVNVEKLNEHGYENAHGTRPYTYEHYKHLHDYINANDPCTL